MTSRPDRAGPSPERTSPHGKDALQARRHDRGAHSDRPRNPGTPYSATGPATADPNTPAVAQRAVQSTGESIERSRSNTPHTRRAATAAPAPTRSPIGARQKSPWMGDRRRRCHHARSERRARPPKPAARLEQQRREQIPKRTTRDLTRCPQKPWSVALMKHRHLTHEPIVAPRCDILRVTPWKPIRLGSTGPAPVGGTPRHVTASLTLDRFSSPQLRRQLTCAVSSTAPDPGGCSEDAPTPPRGSPGCSRRPSGANHRHPTDCRVSRQGARALPSPESR